MVKTAHRAYILGIVGENNARAMGCHRRRRMWQTCRTTPPIPEPILRPLLAAQPLTPDEGAAYMSPPADRSVQGAISNHRRIMAGQSYLIVKPEHFGDGQLPVYRGRVAKW